MPISRKNFASGVSPQNVAACQKHKSRHSDGADDDAGRPTTAAVVDDGELVRGGNTKASGGDGEFIKFDVDCQNHKEKEADRDIRIRQYVTDESIVTRSHADVAECKDSVMSSHVEAASAEAVRYRRGCLLLGIDRVVGDDAVAVAAAAAAPETFQCGGNDDNCDDEDDDALDAHTYLTRYGIDHFGQSKGLCHEVVVEECVPCCRSCCSHGHGEDDKNKNGASSMAIVIGGLLVSAIRSEIFLYTLHVTAIVLGAVKEGIGLRYTDQTLNLIQSIIETSATLLLILIRMFNAFAGYRRVRQTLQHVVHFGDDAERSEDRCGEIQRYPSEEIHIRLIRRWMIAQLCAGLCLVAVCVGCFFVFLFHVHLGWTILSNNFCLITITVLSSLYVARVTVAVTRITEDIHKVVIYDAQLIISENAPTGVNDSCDKPLNFAVNEVGCLSSATADALRFVRAVDNTKLFFRPPYITLCTEDDVERRDTSIIINRDEAIIIEKPTSC